MNSNCEISFDYSGMMESAILEHGIFDSDLLCAIRAAGRCAASMKEKRDSMKWRELPHNQHEVLRDIKEYASRAAESYDAFVVLGIGGSALGSLFVHTALSHMHYNELPHAIRKTPRIYIEDNIDPERMEALFDIITPEKTLFNVITKSGATSETMSQFLIVCSILKDKLGDSFSNNVVVTTDESKGNLIGIAKSYGMKTYCVPNGVGGRFSVLCPVGLLPAAICGIDIEAMLNGAAEFDANMSDTVSKNGAYMFAVMQMLALNKGCNISVMMPYADSLRYLSDWYAQLWAESLGKKKNICGMTKHIGQTPAKALGVTDQHSQVQLYTDGPFDKVITFVTVDSFRSTITVPAMFTEVSELSFLHGHTLNELITAEARATEYAIAQSGHMANAIRLKKIDAYSIGQLIIFLEIATAFAGELLEIDAFDQPGVEAGKKATFALLGREGYESMRDEILNNKQKEDKYTV